MQTTTCARSLIFESVVSILENRSFQFITGTAQFYRNLMMFFLLRPATFVRYDEEPLRYLLAVLFMMIVDFFTGKQHLVIMIFYRMAKPVFLLQLKSIRHDMNTFSAQKQQQST